MMYCSGQPFVKWNMQTVNGLYQIPQYGNISMWSGQFSFFRMRGWVEVCFLMPVKIFDTDWSCAPTYGLATHPQAHMRKVMARWFHCLLDIRTGVCSRLHVASCALVSESWQILTAWIIKGSLPSSACSWLRWLEWLAGALEPGRANKFSFFVRDKH